MIAISVKYDRAPPGRHHAGRPHAGRQVPSTRFADATARGYAGGRPEETRMKPPPYEPFPHQVARNQDLPASRMALLLPVAPRALTRRELLRGAQALGVATLASGPSPRCGSGDESAGPATCSSTASPAAIRCPTA